METIIFTEFLKALGDGNITKGCAWILIFVCIWLQVRGLTTQVKKLNETVANGFAKGETRFSNIEGRLVALETKP